MVDQDFPVSVHPLHRLYGIQPQYLIVSLFPVGYPMHHYPLNDVYGRVPVTIENSRFGKKGEKKRKEKAEAKRKKRHRRCGKKKPETDSKIEK